MSDRYIGPTAILSTALTHHRTVKMLLASMPLCKDGVLEAAEAASRQFFNWLGLDRLGLTRSCLGLGSVRYLIYFFYETSL